MRRQRAYAFTLIELLVVVAIIVALIAILLPSMNKAIEVSQRAVCASQVHQQDLSIRAYAADYKLTLPPALNPAFWPDGQMNTGVNAPGGGKQPAGQAALYAGGYMDDPTIVYCPSNSHSTNQWTNEDVGFKAGNWVSTYLHYDWWGGGYRSVYSGQAGLDPIEPLIADRITSPSTAVLVTDNITVDVGPDHTPSQTRNHLGEGKNPSGGNVLTLDGAAQWRDFAETELRLSVPPAASFQRDFYF